MRAKTEAEEVDEQKENIHTEMMEPRKCERELKNEKSFKRMLVEETVKKLKLMKDSTKVLRKAASENSVPKR